MMGTQFGLLLGLDNAIVALALGPFNPGPRRMVLVGFTFATAEIVMTLGGALGGSALALVAESAGEAIRVGVLLLLAAAIVGLASAGQSPAVLAARPSALLALTMLLGLDNLVAGAGLASAGASATTVVVAAIVSGGVAAAACGVGSLSARLVAPSWRAAATAALLATAALAGAA